MTLGILADNFDSSSSATFAAPWTAVSGTWRKQTYQPWSGSASSSLSTLASGAAFYVNAWASGNFGATPATMGKLVLATDYYSQLSTAAGNTTNKHARLTTYLRWADQTDQFTYNPGGGVVTVDNHDTYLGVIFAGQSSGTTGYAALITRTGGASPTTTLRLVAIGGTAALPTFTSITPGSVTIPNATNGDRWRITINAVWLAPTFGNALFDVTVRNAAGVDYTVGMVGPTSSVLYGTNTGQGALATWDSGQLYVGYFNRPGWKRQSSPVTASGAGVPNRFEELILNDVGVSANTATATLPYALTAEPTLSVATVSTESDNASGETLSVNPSWTQQTTDAWQVNVFKSDSGDRVAFPLQTIRRRVYSFRWDVLDGTEKDTLDAMQQATRGRFSSWLWTDPETGIEGPYRFTTDVTFTQRGPDTWSATAGVEEVL